MSFKATPKSCSCRQCTRSKRCAPTKFRMKLEERAHRHNSNQELRVLGAEAVLLAATYGTRWG